MDAVAALTDAGACRTIDESATVVERPRPRAELPTSYPEPTMSHPPICPRCRHYIPNDLQPGVRPGPRSLVSDVEICSACGLHETLLEAVYLEKPLRWQWPVAVPWDVTTPLTAARVVRHLGLRGSGLAASLRELRDLEAQTRHNLGLPNASTLPAATSDAGRLLHALRGLEAVGVVWGWEQRAGDRAKGRGWWSDGAHLTEAAKVTRPQALVWFDRREVVFDERGHLREGNCRCLHVSTTGETAPTPPTASAADTDQLLALARRVELALQSHGLQALPSLGGALLRLIGPLSWPS